jgi:hypothetical protein
MVGSSNLEPCMCSKSFGGGRGRTCWILLSEHVIVGLNNPTWLELQQGRKQKRLQDNHVTAIQSVHAPTNVRILLNATH